MHLALHRAGADRAPRDEIGVILAERRIEKLRRDRQAEAGDVGHQPAGEPQAVVDLVTAVERRVVDQAFPANDGAWLFKINPHHQQQVRRIQGHDRLEPRRVVQGGHRIVDRTGTHDHEQPVVAAVHDRRHFAPAAGDQLRARIIHRHLFFQNGRGQQGLDRADAEVGGGLVHGRTDPRPRHGRGKDGR
jgi:hypothetical protein